MNFTLFDRIGVAQHTRKIMKRIHVKRPSRVAASPFFTNGKDSDLEAQTLHVPSQYGCTGAGAARLSPMFGGARHSTELYFITH